MNLLGQSDLIVLSHLRWDFVFQRPQHLLTRFATQARVFFFEEPVFGCDIPSLEIVERQNGVQKVVPHLPSGSNESRIQEQLRTLMDRLITEQDLSDFVLWYYTPMAVPFTDHIKPRAVIYDCMDELSMFKGAHPELLENETRLFERADVVFTGGQSLYEFKKDKHPNVHPFPSSIDFDHFHQARSGSLPEPTDQQGISGPKMGFFGVIDERMDLQLLEGVARARPDWQLIILGPVVKINPDTLPRLPNIHYLGQKTYAELPAYIAGWDVALMPFAINDSTRFISPTKTPEYLAAGKPVVSTPIQDVIRPYGERELVFTAGTVDEFVRSIESALDLVQQSSLWQKKVDEFLDQTSWDITCWGMANLLNTTIERKTLSQLEAS